MKEKLLIAIAIFFYSIQMNAQVSLILDDQKVEIGEVFTADVKVKDFKDIVSLQFTMTWDKEVLELIGVENYALQDLNDTKFGLFPDILTVTWIEPMFAGASLADSTALFSIKFRAIQVRDSSVLAIEDVPGIAATMEFSDVNENLLDVMADSSFITVVDDSMTSTSDFQHQSLALHPNYPNPFTQTTIIPIESDYPQRARLRLLDQHGKVTKTINLRLSAGKNLIELNSSLFPTAGIYYYQLSTDYYAKTKKLAVLR